MPRVVHVKAAQQRYKQVPVIDPATGVQKITPVLKKQPVLDEHGNVVVPGVPKVTKSGRAVVMRISGDDKTQPLPPRKCGHCSEPIAIGTPYKSIAVKSTYGSTKYFRHESCPTWQPWEYSTSLSATLAQIVHNASVPDDIASKEDAEQILSEAADEIDGIAEQKRESASNIEEGFGHTTSASEELESMADELESWAENVRTTEIPDEPEPEEDECDECGGEGHVDKTDDAGEPVVDADGKAIEEECEQCNGTGQFTPDEPTEEQWETWREEVRDAVDSALSESPA